MAYVGRDNPPITRFRAVVGFAALVCCPAVMFMLAGEPHRYDRTAARQTGQPS